jgi:hypothetical protein
MPRVTCEGSGEAALLAGSEVNRAFFPNQTKRYIAEPYGAAKIEGRTAECTWCKQTVRVNYDGNLAKHSVTEESRMTIPTDMEASREREIIEAYQRPDVTIQWILDHFQLVSPGSLHRILRKNGIEPRPDHDLPETHAPSFPPRPEVRAGREWLQSSPPRITIRRVGPPAAELPAAPEPSPEPEPEPEPEKPTPTVVTAALTEYELQQAVVADKKRGYSYAKLRTKYGKSYHWIADVLRAHRLTKDSENGADPNESPASIAANEALRDVQLPEPEPRSPAETIPVTLDGDLVATESQDDAWREFNEQPYHEEDVPEPLVIENELDTVFKVTYTKLVTDTAIVTATDFLEAVRTAQETLPEAYELVGIMPIARS